VPKQHPTAEQRDSIRAASDEARAAQKRGEDPRPFSQKAEVLMKKYGGGAEEPVLDEDGNP
jgi:hypothetical protein